MSATSRELGRLIQRSRDGKKLTLRELARLARLEYSWISRLENGQIAKPAPDKLQRLAQALELEIEDLYALSGYAISDRLPDFDAYLRCKYKLPDEAVSQLGQYFRFLRGQHGHGNGGSG